MVGRQFTALADAPCAANFRSFPMFRTLVLFFSLVLTVAAADRDWKDAAGKTIAKGEFIAIMDGQVCIQTPEGLGKRIPLESLSAADQKFAKEAGGEDLGNIEGTLDTEMIGMSLQDKKNQQETVAKAQSAKAANPDLDIDGEDIIAEISDSRGDIQVKVKDERDKYAGQKRVVMFDFESLWDADQESRYGQIMGNMFWMKINRENKIKQEFVIPDSMISVRNVCATEGIRPNPDTPLDKMKEVVTKTFNSDIGIWGKIERVDRDVLEIYDFWMKVVDFSFDPPKIIYQVDKNRTEAVAEVTGIHVRRSMEKLYDKQARTKEENAQIEANWEKNPNLVVGGDFERVQNGVPVGWETHCAQHREPIGRLVKRIVDPENPKNHILHTEFDADIGDGFGLMYYSKPFPIEETATYRLQIRFKRMGVRPILFVKCSDTIDTVFRPTSGALREGFTDRAGQQTREVYRSQQMLYHYPDNQWITHTEDFTPRHTRFSPKYARIMLYGYLGAGAIQYDDVIVKKIKEPDAAELRAKIERHSLDSKVTLKEMEANERRADEAREKIQRERRSAPAEDKTKLK